MTLDVDAAMPPKVTLRIGGEILETGTAGSVAHVSPVTGRADAQVPLAGPEDVDRAVRAAHEAFLGWRALPPPQRARLLGRFADLIDANAQEFARLAVLDNGTPYGGSVHTASIAAGWMRFYAGWADKVPMGRITTLMSAGNEFGYTLRQPYGVIGVIITWNAPLMSLCMKIPAALAAGNSVVVKPSELTPFSAMLFADLAREAGLPDGVLNVLTGDGAAGAALVDHPLVKKVSFTGGPETARKISAACAVRFKPLVLELGGKSANLVFDDADLDEVAPHATYMALGILSGQGCALPTRLLVQDTVYEELLAKVAMVASHLKVGNPFEPDTVSGPVVNQAAVDRIERMIARAKADGARLVTGGERLGGALADGYFLAPTVFADVKPDSELGQVEVFGPVLAVIPFATEEDAIAIANDTEYGLSGAIWTSDLRRATRVAEKLATGEVMINGAANANFQRPFGGIGLSGMGKEGGIEGLEEFLWTKSVAVADAR